MFSCKSPRAGRQNLNCQSAQKQNFHEQVTEPRCRIVPLTNAFSELSVRPREVAELLDGVGGLPLRPAPHFGPHLLRCLAAHQRQLLGNLRKGARFFKSLS